MQRGALDHLKHTDLYRVRWQLAKLGRHLQRPNLVFKTPSLESTIRALRRTQLMPVFPLQMYPTQSEQVGEQVPSSILRETQWGSISNTTEGECSWEVDRTPKSFFDETPEFQHSVIRILNTPEQIEQHRTEEWVNASVMQITERVGITFGIGCRCTKAILDEINAAANESIKGKQSLDTNEVAAAEEEREAVVVDAE